MGGKGLLWPRESREAAGPIFRVDSQMLTFIKERGMGCIQLTPRTDDKEKPPTVLSPPVNQGLG